MLREEIDKLFQQAYTLENEGNKHTAYKVYCDAIIKFG
jgi:hypothetical protein